MEESAQVAAYIDDTRVEGRIVSADKRVLRVEITSPYSGVTGETVTIPEDFSHRHRYLDPKGSLTEEGLEAARRVLEEIYLGAHLVEKQKKRLFTLYQHFLRETPAEPLYSLFTYINRSTHRKISYDTFRQLMKKIVLQQ